MKEIKMLAGRLANIVKSLASISKKVIGWARHLASQTTQTLFGVIGGALGSVGGGLVIPFFSEGTLLLFGVSVAGPAGAVVGAGVGALAGATVSILAHRTFTGPPRVMKKLDETSITIEEILKAIDEANARNAPDEVMQKLWEQFNRVIEALADNVDESLKNIDPQEIQIADASPEQTDELVKAIQSNL